MTVIVRILSFYTASEYRQPVQLKFDSSSARRTDLLN